MQRRLEAVSDGVDRATIWLGWIGGICLVAIVAILGVGVVMRYVFAAPLQGDNEIVQMTAVALVMSSLPYCTARNGHVAVDMFERAIGRWGRLFGDLLSRGLSGTILSILCYRATLKALDAWEWGDATNMLRLPLWPSYAVLATGAGLCAVVFALQFLLILREGPQR